MFLAINVGVFVNADIEVKKHLDENFSEHKQKVDKYLKDVQETAGKIKAELELAHTITKQAQSIQTPEI